MYKEQICWFLRKLSNKIEKTIILSTSSVIITTIIPQAVNHFLWHLTVYIVFFLALFLLYKRYLSLKITFDFYFKVKKIEHFSELPLKKNYTTSSFYSKKRKRLWWLVSLKSISRNVRNRQVKSDIRFTYYSYKFW